MVTDPDGNVTYTVYDDPDQEYRVYPGWNSQTDDTTGPVQVYRQDYAGNYVESLAEHSGTAATARTCRSPTTSPTAASCSGQVTLRPSTRTW